MVLRRVKMSRIEFEQISDDVIEVIIPPQTPLEMVQQLTKGFTARGLVEDLQKSTLSVRYFYRPENKVNDLADKLIKSLQGIAKADELPYWHPKAQAANQKRVREQRVAERQAKVGVTPKGVAEKPTLPTLEPKSYTSSHPKMVDTDAANQKTADGTGKRYAYIKDPVKKDEDEIEKSGYGPKKGGQYSPVDNAKRKANNMDPVEGIGPNTNAKSYSSKPGQLSGKQSADLTARIQNKANKKQPVKVFTPEEIAAMAPRNPDGSLKKSWGQHLPFPSAEDEIMALAKNQPLQDGESAAANQLAALMAGKSMLGKNVPPAIKAMFAAPPAQPTDQQMFGHLVVTEEMVKAKEQEWQGAAFNWLAEAAKPITKQFNSEAEEIAYWDSIKVSDRDDGKSGY